MSLLRSLLLPPTLLLLSLPLALLATLTSILAFSTLFLRALIVYIELAAALLQAHFSPHHISPLDFPPSSQQHTPLPPAGHSSRLSTSSRVLRRGSSTSSAASNAGSMTPTAAGTPIPKVPETRGVGIYAGGGPGGGRDFEGVGGWRVDGDEEEERWVGINSRLELPNGGIAGNAAGMIGVGGGTSPIVLGPTPAQEPGQTQGRQRNHHRSRTSGSNSGNALSGFFIPAQSQNTRQRPELSRTKTSSSVGSRVQEGPAGQGGNGGRQGYTVTGSKSTTALDTSANIGRALLRHKGSSSSESTAGSSGGGSSGGGGARGLGLTMSHS